MRLGPIGKLRFLDLYIYTRFFAQIYKILRYHYSFDIIICYPSIISLTVSCRTHSSATTLCVLNHLAHGTVFELVTLPTKLMVAEYLCISDIN